ncbi:MAG: Ribosome-binding factor A [candidate division TA06 bacterium ADurb.Bin417]|uniref:Ribosome-binding factor A n=1 Tax=candidate division TA06 bacterium ADurb.Bin417 TaxID=1852828 RepID=A0A1V5M9M3_UNCT6|nr:MAG: Ribosome-binding factor A [candidate division TA06 bacterium ADurb.Bin417]
MAGLIHRLLAEALQKELTETTAWKINITKVDLSPDLRHARVFFLAITGPEDRLECEQMLKANTPVLKKAMARNLRVRFQPEISFVWDEALQATERVDEILDRLSRERRATEVPASETEDKRTDD